MKETNWENALEDLRHQLDLIQSLAHEDSVRFEKLREQIESTKIRFLVYQLGTRRKFLARSRGVASLVKHKKTLPLLGVSAGMSIITGLITKDGVAAMNVGTRGFNGALRRLGETRWAVFLGNNLEIAPLDNLRQGKDWVTWNSLMIAMHELELRAQEEALGNLDNIVAELRKSKSLAFVSEASTGGTIT